MELWTHATVPREHRDKFIQWCRNMKSAHGMTVEQFNKCLASQDGACALCDRKHSFLPRSSRLQVDHCHKTNRIRGLLCQRCNTGLGKLGDSAESLLKALRYVTGATEGWLPRARVNKRQRWGRWYLYWNEENIQRERAIGRVSEDQAEQQRLNHQWQLRHLPAFQEVEIAGGAK